MLLLLSLFPLFFAAVVITAIVSVAIVAIIVGTVAIVVVTIAIVAVVIFVVTVALFIVFYKVSITFCDRLTHDAALVQSNKKTEELMAYLTVNTVNLLKLQSSTHPS